LQDKRALSLAANIHTTKKGYLFVVSKDISLDVYAENYMFMSHDENAR